MSWTAVGRQLANPSGVGGRLVGAIMRVANKVPTEALVGALQIDSTHRVLDIGCGDGTALAAVPQAAYRSGLDRSATMLSIAGKALRRPLREGRASLVQGDMMNLPYEPNSFDRLLASNILYFCRDVPSFIDQCRRVARPGASLGIYVTAAESMAKWRFAGSATHRHFSRQDLESELRESGLGRADFEIDALILPGEIEGLLAVVRL
ncbi:class I SAM-dependent methyltransferase [Sphingomonas alba]|uniref:Class I SAM-dependent methyltransferase n=1 Tax=Sphingomonas alba TaxID=2908208 RepID=A0ABT0RPK5_9SPHN|nr:class I SAM-dependent methyltransferase [Sphingomonas alba]MCL6684485.1 class I SAM-dependent methyltransferase [Sphingomonas alba]